MKNIKKIGYCSVFLLLMALPASYSQAQIPIVGLFTSVIKKVIMALDLKVQQLQNKTLVLQNAQKQLENSLSLNKLGDISGWLKKEKSLYSGYYQELSKVKSLISSYQRVRQIVTQQTQLVSEYRAAKALFNRDAHFSPGELSYMGTIYNGILQESLRSMDKLLLAVTPGKAQLNDAERLQLIDEAETAMQLNLDHLRQFNAQNQQLSLARSMGAADREAVERLYGIKE
jgi:hypothetical protein